MQIVKKVSSFSIEDSNIIKGVGILLIAFHNFFHWVSPSAKENEFSFKADGIHNFIHSLSTQPLESINQLFSFWGHFGVQLFIFISGYGLMRAYQHKQIKWGSFVAKRINKLWPTFFIAVVVFYSLFRIFYFHFDLNHNVLISYFLKLTFLSNFFQEEQLILNGPWWFYGMIVQLYMVFPLLLKLHRKYGAIALIIISIISYIISFIFNPWLVANHNSLYFFFIANIPAFSLGIILATKEKFRYNRLIGLGAFVLFGIGNYYLSFWYFSHLMFTIFSLGLIYFSLLQGKRSSIFYKTIRYYGELSMYLFAIHGFLRYPFIKLTKEYNHPLLDILWAVLFLITATVVALLLKWVVNNYLKYFTIATKKAQEITSSFVLFILEGTKSIMQIGFAFVFILALLRIYEYGLLSAHHDIQFVNWHLLLDVILRDILIGIGLLGILLIPFLMVYRISKVLAKSITIIFFNLIILSSIILIQYFDITLIPLDRVIYAYSYESILEISKTSELTMLSILPFVLSILTLNTLLFFAKKLKFKRLFIFLFIIVSIGLSIIHNRIIPKEYNFENQFKFYYSNNKLLYFVKDLIRYDPSKGVDLSQIGNSIKAYRKTFDDRKFLSLNFPFLRKADEGDPLEPYFNKTKTGQKPNIVFILVESLSTPISGPYCYKTSFTPFLDSLTGHSLYWRNNLSTSERTFGVLPSALASLPYGKKGFVDMGQDMPEHQSIINILANNEYTTRFFYGGWTHFNNMDIYMNINNIDTVINDFNPEDSIPKNSSGFSWGYSDRAIFQSTFNTIKDSSDSYLSIYLTLSTHSPFVIKNAKHYEQQVLDRMKEFPIPENEHAGYITNLSKLATWMYFDDEIRKFFEAYKKRNDFENTIFIITGDHRGVIFFRTSQIDVYHTPLIIYSPLLKKGVEFGGVSSHADITPSLLNYLGNNYQIKTPNKVSWQGSLLDTSRQFHSRQRMAFMRNNRDIRDYIDGNYYLASDNLYEVHDTLHLRKIDDPKIKAKLKSELEVYKTLNEFSFMGLQKKAKSKLINLTNSLFNFEDSIPDCFKDDISDKMAYSGKKSLLMKKDQEFASLLPNIILEQGISRLYIEIEFKVYVETFGEFNPKIVASITNGPKTISWNSIDIMNDNFGTDKRWKTIKVSKTVALNPNDSKGAVFKLYLWNRHACKLYYDDIKVSIKAKQLF